MEKQLVDSSMAEEEGEGRGEGAVRGFDEWGK